MPPRELTGERAVLPQVEISASGEGIASWSSFGPDRGRGGGPVAMAIRPPGGQFGPSRGVTPPAAGFGGMVTNEFGDASLFFYDEQRNLHEVFRPALGDLMAPVEVGDWERPSMDATGNVTFLEIRTARNRDDGRHLGDTLEVVRRSRDGTFGPVRRIVRSGMVYNADFHADRAGNVTLVWRERPVEGGNPQPFVATAPVEGEFSAPRPLASPAPDHGTAGSWIRLVTNDRGDLLAAWGQQASDAQYSVDHVLHSSFRPVGGDFGPVEAVPLPEEANPGLFGWDIAMDATGEVVAAWGSSNGVWVATLPASGPWVQARSVSRRGRDSRASPSLAIDGKGTATIAYVEALTRFDENGYGRPAGMRMMAVRRPRGERLGEPETLASAKNMFTPDVAADPLGNAIVVWSHDEVGSWDSSRTEKGIDSAIWDAREPSISRFQFEPDAQLPDGEGPAFEYALSEAAQLTITVERSARRPKRVAKLKFRAGRGVGARAIDERLARDLSAAGTYRATIVARDSADRRSKARRVSFGSLKRR